MTPGSTRVFAVLGDPVAHSLSPRMHGAAFAALGLDAVYVAISASDREAPAIARALCRAGGGASITAPGKEAVAAAADAPSARVRELERCNTVWGEAGGMAADNTDVDGVRGALAALGVQGGDWLIAGTGGAARAVAAAAREVGAAVAVRSRSPARAAAFAAWLDARGVARAEASACRVLVNATPLGRNAGDPLPFAASDEEAATAALDLVYARGGTPWVRQMAAHGIAAADGRTVLVAQGVAAWRCWFPGVEPPEPLMHEVVGDALR